ncbi:MAG: VOC family protein [Chitinophagales bacterium]
MDAKANIINWFEISVENIMRARRFYEAVFNIKLEVIQMIGMEMAMFPSERESGKVSGAIVQSKMHKPSTDGAKIYFNGDPDLADALSRVEAAGGKITMPKTSLGDSMGFMAFFLDTEGNSVALHSLN